MDSEKTCFVLSGASRSPPKEILTEDEVKCSLLTSPFIEPGNPSLSACTLIRSVGDSENRRCGVHNESGQSLRRDLLLHPQSLESQAVVAHGARANFPPKKEIGR